MNIAKLVLLGAAVLAASPTLAQVRLYEHDDFRGRGVDINRPMRNLEGLAFNDIASSAVVRGGPWELCEHARFQGRCVVLRPGRYRSFNEMGMNDIVSSLRPADPRARAHGDYSYYGPETSESDARGGEAGLYPREPR